MGFRKLLVLGLLISGTANAKLFRNAYVSFELPPNWNCKLEGSEWVCENDFASKTKEAIIILSAKEVGPTDTLPAYLAHLQTPRNLPGRNGAPTKSQIINVKERMIGNHMWVDGLHLGSEVGPYFTRYLATIKDRIAILVTFSAHKEHYTKYSNDFIKAIESLKVVANKDTLNSRGGLGTGVSGETTPGTVGVPPGQVMQVVDQADVPPPSGGGKNGILVNLLLFAVILGGIGYYLFLKAKKTKKPLPPSNSSSKTKPKKK